MIKKIMAKAQEIEENTENKIEKREKIQRKT